MKKTLIIKLSTDVSGANDGMIEAYKTFWHAALAPIGLEMSYEVVEEHEESTAQRLLSLVRSEFRDLEAELDSIEIVAPGYSDEQP